MKTRKPKRISKRMERLLPLQVQEYIDRYYPHLGKVDISISPSGTLAAVREKPPGGGQPKLRSGKEDGALAR